MDSQAPTMYDVPRSSLASVDAQPHSINKRSSIPSGYHNHLLTRSRSQDHGDSGYNSMGSGRTPPTLDSSAPPLRLDKHPSIRRKRDSDGGINRRGSNSVQSPYGSYTDREASDPAFFECDEVGGAPRGSLSRCTSHTSSDSPPECDGYITGHMDGDSESTSSGVVSSGTGSIISSVAGGRHYDVVRTRGGMAVAAADGHPHYIPQAPGVEGQNGDEYMRMIHPKTKACGDEYVYMKPSGAASSVSPPSAGKSQSIPVPMPQQQQQQQQSEYNTLQHFREVTVTPQQRNAASNGTSYETLPPIAEGKQQSNANHPHHHLRRENYENHPMPQELKGVVPRTYCPNYENRYESDFRGRRGSHGQDSYENVGGRGGPSPTNKLSSSPQPILVNSNSNNSNGSYSDQCRPPQLSRLVQAVDS